MRTDVSDNRVRVIMPLVAQVEEEVYNLDVGHRHVDLNTALRADIETRTV